MTQEASGAAPGIAIPGGFPALRGKRVAIPAPSYQMLRIAGGAAQIDHERREAALANMARLGMVTTLLEGAMEMRGRYAGPDERRAQDLEAALLLSGADLVMPLRGGYGMTRLLHMLDWEAIGRAGSDAIGFSDFTAFNLALLAKTGRASWQGPMAASFARPDTFTMERLAAALAGPASLEWRPDAEHPELLGGVDLAKPSGMHFSGTVWGGNLCLLESLVGTPWLPGREITDGGILFLEDVAEASYRVERMLLTLLEAGILARQRAILLGSFTNADDARRFPGDHALGEALSYIRSRLPGTIPMVTNLPFGHVPAMATLPVGRAGELALGRSEEGVVARLAWR